MKIAVLTLPYEVANEAKKINNLFKMGLEELHIRKPGYGRDKMIEFINEIDSRFYNRIVLHNNFSLSLKFKLKGIHVDRDYFEGFMGYFRKRKYTQIADFHISTVVNSIDKLAKVDEVFSKVAIGPLVKKLSENNLNIKFDAVNLKSEVQKSTLSLYAMGGINLSNILKFEQFGFDAAIVQAAIWKSDDYLEAFEAFQSAHIDRDEFVEKSQTA